MKIREITYIALFAAVMGVLGLVPPIMLAFTPVPITLQTLGVMLAGGILGARLGSYSQIVFLLIIAAGMPLLSGGRGGLGVFVGPSAGYALAFPIAAFCVGYILSKFKTVSFKHILFTNLTAGIFILYLFGIPVQAFVMNLSIIDIMKVSVAYLPGDILKAVLATFVVYKLRKHSVFARITATSNRAA